MLSFIKKIIVQIPFPFIYIFIGVCKVIKNDEVLLKLLLKKLNMTIYFENITVELHIFYIFNTYVKFRINQIWRVWRESSNWSTLLCPKASIQCEWYILADIDHQSPSLLLAKGKLIFFFLSITFHFTFFLINNFWINFNFNL